MTSFIDSKPVRKFGVQWFSVVMGTGALASSMFLTSSCFTFFLMFAQIFLFLPIGMFLFFLILWVIMVVYHVEKVKKELHRPIIGNFFPTMPISVIVIGIACNGIGPTLFSSPQIFGWLILLIIFMFKKIDLEHANYGLLNPLTLLNPWRMEGILRNMINENQKYII